MIDRVAHMDDTKLRKTETIVFFLIKTRLKCLFSHFIFFCFYSLPDAYGSSGNLI